MQKFSRPIWVPRKRASRARQQPWSGPQDAVLTAINLAAGYGAAPVLQKVSIEVRPGEMVALIGANGAGKSTLMRAIAGLLRPVEGEVILDDRRIERSEAHRIAARGLALVPEGRQVFPELSVYDNLELGANTRDNVDYAGRNRGAAETLSAAARSPEQPRRPVVRRRAADAGDRARHDGQDRASCCSTSRRWAWRRR